MLTGIKSHTDYKNSDDLFVLKHRLEGSACQIRSSMKQCLAKFIVLWIRTSQLLSLLSSSPNTSKILRLILPYLFLAIKHACVIPFLFSAICCVQAGFVISFSSLYTQDLHQKTEALTESLEVDTRQRL